MIIYLAITDKRHMRQYLYRTLALALLLLAAGNTAHAVAVLTVNGNPAYCDTARCMLLASVPEQWFGTSMTATVDNTNGFTVQSIDGLPLGDDRAYTFENMHRPQRREQRLQPAVHLVSHRGNGGRLWL